jgi:alpha-galactosidase
VSISVAIVGAGSVGFTRTMVRDILCVPEFRDADIRLTDISARNLDMVHELLQRDIASSKLKAKLSATRNRRAAFRGADYVFSFVRVGGLEAFATDIEVPLAYGVDQCVGDTLAPGGIMYGQRTIPVLLEFCRDIAEVAAPDCLLLNYSNPMAMNTWACAKHGGVRVIGLCHGVIGGHELIAKAFGLRKDEVDIVCAGINHQTWYVSIRHRGEDLTGKLLEALEADPEIARTEKVRSDMLRRFGCFSTESNGHLSEYLPWYRKRINEIPRWIDLSSWIHGETGGYLRVCTEGRARFEHDFPDRMREPPLTFRPEDRGREHGSFILEGLETGRPYRGHVNVVNRGVITNLPPDCVVEVPGWIDANGIGIPVVGDLPLGCAAVCNASVSVQRLSVEAAVSGDDRLLRQAFMMDPLTGAVLDPPEIWQLVDDMLIAGERWLPQYRKAIAAAKRRAKGGKRLPTREFRAAAAPLPSGSRAVPRHFFTA